jgi:hypothetical protein
MLMGDADVDADADGGMVVAGYRVLAGEMVYRTDALAVVERICGKRVYVLYCDKFVVGKEGGGEGETIGQPKGKE